MHGLCVAVPYGTWDEGQLVLFELGIGLDLRPLDIVIFYSAYTTHFNMRYTGKRGSVVLNTDRTIQEWTKNKNGWERHNFPAKVFDWDSVAQLK
jgi:hypothetical protein